MFASYRYYNKCRSGFISSQLQELPNNTVDNIIAHPFGVLASDIYDDDQLCGESLIIAPPAGALAGWLAVVSIVILLRRRHLCGEPIITPLFRNSGGLGGSCSYHYNSSSTTAICVESVLLVSVNLGGFSLRRNFFNNNCREMPANMCLSLRKLHTKSHHNYAPPLRQERQRGEIILYLSFGSASLSASPSRIALLLVLSLSLFNNPPPQRGIGVWRICFVVAKQRG